MVEEQDQEPEEKLKIELPGLFGGRKRRKSGGTPPDGERPDEEPTEALQPFEDEADEPAPDDEDDDVEEAPAPAPASRFASPGTGTGSTESDVEETRQLPATGDVVWTGSTTEGSSTTEDVGSATGEPAATEKKPRKPKKARKPLPPLTVAVVVGLFIGVLACGLTYAGMIACQEIQGTTACGGPGFFVLMAILMMLVAVGSFLLKTFGVPDPTSTSLLAMGLVAVVALAFLIDVIFAWWMIIVIPLLSAGAYAGSHWLTHVFETTDVEG